MSRHFPGFVPLTHKYMTLTQIHDPNTQIHDPNTQIHNPNTQIRDPALSWLGTDISIKSDEIKLV
jgi:hypothetical protein